MLVAASKTYLLDCHQWKGSWTAFLTYWHPCISDTLIHFCICRQDSDGSLGHHKPSTKTSKQLERSWPERLCLLWSIHQWLNCQILSCMWEFKMSWDGPQWWWWWFCICRWDHCKECVLLFECMSRNEDFQLSGLIGCQTPCMCDHIHQHDNLAESNNFLILTLIPVQNHYRTAWQLIATDLKLVKMKVCASDVFGRNIVGCPFEEQTSTYNHIINLGLSSMFTDGCRVLVNTLSHQTEDVWLTTSTCLTNKTQKSNTGVKLRNVFEHPEWLQQPKHKILLEILQEQM